MSSFLRDSCYDNFFVKLCYRLKFYFDLGSSNLTWFSSKLPELMAVIYLLDRFGIRLGLGYVLLFSVLLFVLITFLGFVLRYTGIYATERYVVSMRDPVQSELLTAARRINDPDFVQRFTDVQRFKDVQRFNDVK